MTFVPPARPRLSAGGVADEWVTQMLRQGEAKVFNKYSQMKLQLKREALIKAESAGKRKPHKFCHSVGELMGFGTVLPQLACTKSGHSYESAVHGSGLE